MDEIVVHVKVDGTAQCLWTDQLDLYALGDIQVERASNIEFNNTYQRWEIQGMNGGLITGFATRAAAIEFEHLYLNDEMRMKP